MRICKLDRFLRARPEKRAQKNQEAEKKTTATGDRIGAPLESVDDFNVGGKVNGTAGAVHAVGDVLVSPNVFVLTD